MGDDVVKAIADELESLAFANGISGAHRPIIDAIVNDLRRYGMSDEAILKALTRPSGEQDEGK